MEIPCLELEDLKLAKLVTDLLAPLVITAEKQEKMIRVLEEELDLGLQHGLSGQPLAMIAMRSIVTFSKEQFQAMKTHKMKTMLTKIMETIATTEMIAKMADSIRASHANHVNRNQCSCCGTHKSL